VVTTSQAFDSHTNGAERVSDGLFFHRGKFMVSVGPVELPAGSIGMDELALNSTQQQIGLWFGASAWTVPSINVWHETPVQFNATSLGGLLRLEFSGTIVNPGAQVTYICLGVDGVPTYNIGAQQSNAANLLQTPCSAFIYLTPAAGAHRFSVFLYSNVVGSGFNGSLYTTLSVWEYRR
jgi:hypothetical protein